MTRFALTYDDVKAFHPCGGDFERVARLLGPAWKKRPFTAAEAARAGATRDDLLFVAAQLGLRYRSRMLAADFAAHTLHVYERQNDSEAPRNAVVLARRLAKGEASERERRGAYDAAVSAAYAVSAADAAYAACVACAACAAAYAVSAADAAYAAYAACAAGAQEENAWQLERAILWLSEGEPEPWPLPERSAK